MTDNTREFILDVTGLLCPLPVLKARKRLQSMKPGEELVVLASDPMAAIDVPHFCMEQGHHLIAQSQDDMTWNFRIKRK